jgi:hypothetical protein
VQKALAAHQAQQAQQAQQQAQQALAAAAKRAAAADAATARDAATAANQMLQEKLAAALRKSKEEEARAAALRRQLIDACAAAEEERERADGAELQLEEAQSVIGELRFAAGKSKDIKHEQVDKAEAATAAAKAQLQAQAAAHAVALQADSVKLQQLEQQGSKAKKKADKLRAKVMCVPVLPHGAARRRALALQPRHVLRRLRGNQAGGGQKRGTTQQEEVYAVPAAARTCRTGPSSSRCSC